jgi:hypothetical protein
LALACALADLAIDFLSIFEPFLLEIVRRDPGDKPLEPRQLARRARSVFGIPLMPSHVVSAILRRFETRGYVKRTQRGRAIVANVERLKEIPSLDAKQEESLQRMEALEAALIVFAARERDDETWTHEEANEALRQVSEEFGADIALAAQGRLRLVAPYPGRTLLAVAYRFAAWAFERDPESWQALLEMVRGAMYLSVIYHSDVEGLQARLTQLQAALDTPVALRMLGLSAEPLAEASSELLQLLEAVGATVFVFEHTLDEIRAILERIARKLKRGTRRRRAETEVGTRDEEVLAVARAKGWKAKDIEAIENELDARLAALGQVGVQVRATPPHVVRDHLDEARLGELLRRFIDKQSAEARDKDLRSLTAIDRLRGEITGRDLEHTTAVFVTDNCALARASRVFFREEGRSAAVRHCVIDRDLAAQLFVRVRHERSQETPEKLVLAACWAAEEFPAAVWASHANHIERLGEEEATETDLARVMRTGQIRATAAEEDAEVQTPTPTAASEAQRELDRLEESIATRTTELAALDEKIAAAQDTTEPEPAPAPARTESEGELAVQLGHAQEMLERLRQAVGWLVALVVAVLFIGLLATGVITYGTSLAVAVPAVIVAVVTAVAWGYRLGLKVALAIIGVLVSLVAAGYTIYEGTKDLRSPTRPTTTSTGRPRN